MCRGAVLLLFLVFFFFFFFNDTATTEIYTLSLHDALPISRPCRKRLPNSDSIESESLGFGSDRFLKSRCRPPDRKSTRLNSSHQIISYAVFCLKKKKKDRVPRTQKKKKKQTDSEK